MEISEFAERLLMGTRLEDKLLDPGRLSDERPTPALSIPSLPGRPNPIRLDRSFPEYRFPGLRNDSSEVTRGRALHFFANHELLAIELMAVFLLRFPNAPAAFRRAVAYTITEEQEHFAAYRDRMAELGVSFGEVPVSRYFWDCLSDMATPEQFLSGMSLTLEQANLDFARHYADEFMAIGDTETSQLLERVYEDEIGHVSLGVEWLEALRDENDKRSLWTRYTINLKPPLSPSRAKGSKGMDIESRRRAGLDDDFIENLSLYRRSRGRKPDVYLFNPGAEALLGRDAANSSQPSSSSERVATDLTALPMLLASKDDIVLTRQLPSKEFCGRMLAIGLELPEFVQVGGLQGRQLGEARPWAQTRDALGTLNSALSFELAPDLAFSKAWS
ncbi:MAG: DUF455 family protein, partial [Myxococcales bacterium]|nr:DUF455 family protein [Myxococcales bacterium]